MTADEMVSAFTGAAVRGSDADRVVRVAVAEAERIPEGVEVLVTRVVACATVCGYEWVRDGVPGATVVRSGGARDYRSGR